MSDPIQIKLSPNAAAIVGSLKTMPDWLLNELAPVMDKQNQLTVGHIQRDYLSFPKSGPVVAIGCRVQTNRLRGSLRASQSVVVGGTLRSAIGSNVVYAAAQEFGFDGEVFVKPHTRKQFSSGVAIGKRGPVKIKKQTGTVNVRGFTRKMHLPGRGFVRRGLADRAGDYTAAFSKAIVNAWKAKGGV